jgi:hypothetical protein
MAADACDRLVWLGPFTHAEAWSESCPPREALGARCLEDRPAPLGAKQDFSIFSSFFFPSFFGLGFRV